MTERYIHFETLQTKKKFQGEFKRVFLETRFCSKTQKSSKVIHPIQKSLLRFSQLLEKKGKKLIQKLEFNILTCVQECLRLEVI